MGEAPRQPIDRFQELGNKWMVNEALRCAGSGRPAKSKHMRHFRTGIKNALHTLTLLSLQDSHTRTLTLDSNAPHV